MTPPLRLVAMTSAERPLVALVGLGDLIPSHCDSVKEDEINLSDLFLGHRDQADRTGGHLIERGHSKVVTSIFEPKPRVTKSVSEVIDPRKNYVVTWPAIATLVRSCA